MINTELGYDSYRPIMTPDTPLIFKWATRVIESVVFFWVAGYAEVDTDITLTFDQMNSEGRFGAARVGNTLAVMDDTGTFTMTILAGSFVITGEVF